MEILTKIKEVITDPSYFFDSADKEHGIREALIYLLVLGIVPSTLGVIAQFLIGSLLNPSGTDSAIFSLIFLPIGMIGAYIMLFIITFITTGILHVWIMLWGGTGDYSKTFNLFVYANTPNLLFSFIPLFGLVGWIWNLVLLVMATEKMHDVSRGKAIAIYVLPLVLIVLFSVLILAFALAALSSMFLTPTA